MRSTSWMTLLFFIAGCPTPPEEGPGTAPPGGPQPPGEQGAAATAGGAAGSAVPGGPAGNPTAGPPGAAAGGTLIKITGDPPSETVKLDQDKVKAGEHVTISGTVKCEGCTEALVLRVTEIPEPGASGAPTPPALVTQLSLAAAGDFSIAVPKQDKGLVLELLVDGNGNGAPSKGERMAVLPLLDTLMPSESRSGVTIDGTDREVGEAGPPAIPEQDPNAPPPGPAPEGGVGTPPKAGEVVGGPPAAAPPAGGG